VKINADARRSQSFERSRRTHLINPSSSSPVHPVTRSTPPTRSLNHFRCLVHPDFLSSAKPVGDPTNAPSSSPFGCLLGTASPLNRYPSGFGVRSIRSRNVLTRIFTTSCQHSRSRWLDRPHLTTFCPPLDALLPEKKANHPVRWKPIATHDPIPLLLASVDRFKSRVFSAQLPSLGALLRGHSSMAASKPTNLLSTGNHLLCSLRDLWGP